MAGLCRGRINSPKYFICTLLKFACSLWLVVSSTILASLPAGAAVSRGALSSGVTSIRISPTQYQIGCELNLISRSDQLEVFSKISSQASPLAIYIAFNTLGDLAKELLIEQNPRTGRSALHEAFRMETERWWRSAFAVGAHGRGVLQDVQSQADKETERRVLLVRRILQFYSTSVCDILSLPDAEGFTALHHAAWSGRVELIQEIFTACPSIEVNSFSRFHETPLILAAVWSLPSVRLLLQHGARLDLADSEGASVFHVAAVGSNLEVFEYLLSLTEDIGKTLSKVDSSDSSVLDRFLLAHQIYEIKDDILRKRVRERIIELLDHQDLSRFRNFVI